LLNIILDLVILTVCLDQELYLSRHFLIVFALLEVTAVKITKSSANSRWFKEAHDIAILKRRRLLWSIREITSEPIIKIKGKNKPKWLPFNKTEKRGCRNADSNQLIHLEWNPSF